MDCDISNGLRADCDQRGEIIKRQDARIDVMVKSAWALQHRYSAAKAVLAAAAVALRQGAYALEGHGDETSQPMGCLAIAAELRKVADRATEIIEGVRQDS